MRQALALAVVVVAALGVVTDVLARPAAYGLSASKACMTKKGVEFQASVPGQPRKGLSAAQQSEALVGTIPNGGAPAFLYLAIGRNAADALAVRKVLEAASVPNPTASNSWSGASENAAWVVVSLTGSPPAATARALVTSCLTVGAPPTGRPAAPASYTSKTVALCVEADGKTSALASTALNEIAGHLFRAAIPASLLPHVLLIYTSTSANIRDDGIGIFVLFGKTTTDAARERDSLKAALHLTSGAGTWQGTKKNVAWYSFHLHGTTPAGVTSGRRTLLGCLP